MTVVFDANVLAAALGTKGRCREILDGWIRREPLVLSHEVMGEVEQALLTKFKMSQDGARRALEPYLKAARWTAPRVVDSSACRDPDDLHVLGLAKAADADYLVTGDRDLLDLGSFDRTRILTPAEFAAMLNPSTD